jgi:hypothetical protein
VHGARTALAVTPVLGRGSQRCKAARSSTLGGFLMKRTHPLLQKEAKRAIEQSGQVPRKMIVQRR